MFTRVSLALLIAASPALAQEAAPVDSGDGVTAEAPKMAFKTKRVCRSIEVVGSSIPRTTCVTKKIPIKPVEQEADTDPQPSDQAAPAPQSE